VLALQGAARDSALKDFASRTNWHRGAQVDRLSEEEAHAIATRLVHRLEKRVTLAPARATGLREALATRIGQLFVAKHAAGPRGFKMQELRDLAGKYLDARQLDEFEKVVAQGFRRLPDDAS
jgi:hypothetical protein